MERASSETRQGEGGVYYSAPKTHGFGAGPGGSCRLPGPGRLPELDTPLLGTPSPVPLTPASLPKGLLRYPHCTAKLHIPVSHSKAKHLTCLRSVDQAWQHIPWQGSIGTPLFKPRNGVTYKRQVELETTAPGRCWWSGTAHPPQHQLTGEGCALDVSLQTSNTPATLFCCPCPPSTTKLSECSRSQFKLSLKCRNFPYCETVLQDRQKCTSLQTNACVGGDSQDEW